MVKNVKFFKNVIVNSVLCAVVLFTVTFVVVYNTQTVSVLVPIYKGNSTHNVSLMINVYWGTEYIDDMLRILEDNNTKTTFFVGGSWVADNSDMLTKIYNAGHEIGNHGYYHKDHKNLSATGNQEEILSTHQLVKNIIGTGMNLFAPPSGSFSSTTLSVANELDYTTIMWSKDTIDWRDHDKDLIYSRATTDISGGELILMHPTNETVLALDDICKSIKAQGLNITSVSSVLNEN